MLGKGIPSAENEVAIGLERQVNPLNVVA